MKDLIGLYYPIRNDKNLIVGKKLIRDVALYKNTKGKTLGLCLKFDEHSEWKDVFQGMELYDYQGEAVQTSFNCVHLLETIQDLLRDYPEVKRKGKRSIFVKKS